MSAAKELNASGEGWIEWSGGECPVFHGQGVCVLLRLETPSDPHVDEWHRAEAWDWEHNGGCTDIIAYRIYKESAN